MKATGMVRRVDTLGRIVIPKEIRRTLALSDGTPMELFVEGNQIILKNYKPEDNLLETIKVLEKQLEQEAEIMEPEKAKALRSHIKQIRAELRK